MRTYHPIRTPWEQQVTPRYAEPHGGRWPNAEGYSRGRVGVQLLFWAGDVSLSNLILASVNLLSK